MVSQHALQQVLGGGIPACLAGFQAHTQGEVEGHLARGRSPGPHPRGKLRGIWPGGVSRPTPKGEVERDLAGGVSRPTPKGEVEGGLAGGGSPDPHPGGSNPARTEADPPPGRLLLRTERILLECILVFVDFNIPK